MLLLLYVELQASSVCIKC